MAKIEKLSVEVGNRIRGPALIQSLHNAIEELVLNSLDAGADMIEVAIDTRQFSVECRDNGVGIDLTKEDSKLFGKWQCTSKKIEASDTTFGFRGEAVAAISSLSSEFGVVSKCKSGTEIRRGSRPVYFTDGLIKDQSQSGTIVRAGNIFGNLVVRQKSMRIPKEVARVKEFFTKMSLLHHCVSLSLVSFQLVNEGVKRKTLFHQKGQESVSSMFRSFHGEEIASQMVSVDLELHGFRISGLLSPPLPQFCHWTKEYQYSYLGKRWMRGQDLVTHCMNRVYTSIFSAAGVTRGGGPAAKHADPAGRQTSLYPMFVLQLTCTPTEYDLLLEPDKTKVVFKREGQLRACLLSLILSLVQHYVPNFPAPEHFVASILESEGVSSHLLAGFDQEQDEERENGELDEDADAERAEGASEDAQFYNLPSPGDSSGSASPLTNQYRSAFVPSQSPPSKQEEVHRGPPMKKRRTPSFSSSPAASSCTAPSASPLPSPVSRKGGGIEMQGQAVATANMSDWEEEEVGVLFDPPLAAPSWFHKYVNGGAAEHRGDSLSSAVALAEATLAHGGRDLSPDLSFPLRSPPASQFPDTRRIFGATPLAVSSGEAGADSGFSATKMTSSRLRIPVEPVQAMTITKEQLARATAIGQVDRKYLLLHMPPAPSGAAGRDGRQRPKGSLHDLGLLVMADQHAVDERIRLECISKPLGAGLKEVSTTALRETVVLDGRLYDAMVSATDVLHSWGFRWSLPALPSSSSGTAVELTSVPCVHDTALKKADFVEFVSSLASQRLVGSLPSALCRPPAVTRILASRACRSAIKFGDELSLPECEMLVSRLATTDFPFQCAHGRVSVKPVLPLQALATKAKKSPPRPKYENLFSSKSE
jgi:DNA mismatch repair protein MutL